LLNKYGKYKFGRHYFIILSLIFLSSAIFNSIVLGQNRANEVMMIGFSALIIVLFKKQTKNIYFTITWLLTLGINTSRRVVGDLPLDSDAIMAYINISTGFLMVYFFTSMYKNDLLENNRKLKETSDQLEKQQAEISKQRDQISANKKLLRAAIDSLPVFIAMLDMQGNYLLANKKYEETFGIPVEEMEGKHYREVLPDQITDIHDVYIAKGLTGEICDFDDLVEMPGDEKMQALGRYIPVFNDDGQQFALAVYVVDITSLKDAEARLMELNNAKNRLLGLISHDLRAPLKSLKGLIDISGHIDEAEMKQFIEKVSKRLSIVNFSLDNLLEWAKLQMEGFKVHAEEVKLSELIEKSVELFEEQLIRKDLAVRLHGMKDEVRVWVDKESINLVIRNILNNAIKFSPKGSEIEINIVNKDQTTELTITDSGKGMDDQVLRSLKTGAAYLPSSEGTSGEKGTGLGLSLSLELMKANKGLLDFEISRNGGTSVKIKMPAAKVAENT
ncbi:MAG: PAS domain-containing sensor histidine kinase, partial [Fulvivirga sp.]|nr:PAS domain-containing sensor histidine kinase [Fulvivirga sp.]